MNVLSLFDGISCGQLALKRAAIKHSTYFASEVDKHAIAVTQSRFPNTVQLGDVNHVNGKVLSDDISLLIGGTCCQSFSVMGNRRGFDDLRGELFFQYLRLLEETKPVYFLLENVKMKNEWRDRISNYLGVKAVEINSNLVTAQNRKRLYWTNIPFTIPINKNISLVDILEQDVSSEFYLTAEQLIKYNLTSYAGQAGIFSFSEARTEDAKLIRQEANKLGRDYCPRRGKYLRPRTDNKVGCLTTSLTREHIILQNGGLRFITPLEAERLQTIPDNYTNMLNKNARYKVLGNGWTVDIITEILKGAI